MLLHPDPNRPAILIVESEALIRIELKAQLADIGLTTFTASTAAEAIKCMNDHPGIAILLTDITMDGSQDGLRLAHFVRERWPPVKIIVTSGMGGIQPCDLPFGSTFLPKPYGPEHLLQAIAPFLPNSQSTDTASLTAR